MSSQVTISLPEPLATEARAQGLLQQFALELLLKRELARKSFERMTDLRKLPGTAPTEDEIQQEISAARREHRK
jgi:hypothetical protein